MKQYKVEITKEALQDMEDIYNYIAIDLLAPDNAMGQYNRIADEILTLDTFPERFRIMDSEPERIILLPKNEYLSKIGNRIMTEPTNCVKLCL